MKPVAISLRDVRRSARMTQQQLADRLGVERSIYAMYENGKLDPAPRLLEEICTACAVAPDEQRALAAAADL